MLGQKVIRASIVVLATVAIVVGIAGAALAAKTTYKVAADISWPPFEMVDEQGDYVGIDLDIMREIAKIHGYDIEIIDVAFDSIIPGVMSGVYDIGSSGFTITEEREEKIDFSAPYWSSDQAVIIRRDSGLNIATALAQDRKIGAQRGTTGAAWIKDNLIDKGIDVDLHRYETYPMAVLDLLNGNIDAVVQDEPASRASIAKEQNLQMAGIILTGEQFGFLVREGDPENLLPRLNEGVAQLKASGVWDKIIARYLGD